MVEKSNEVPQAILKVDVAISDRDKKDLNLFGQSRKGQKDGKDIINTLCIFSVICFMLNVRENGNIRDQYQ